ncbi:aspartate kinase [Daejeonella rubra]|uniref:Aspartokinase n=1 Tax=Daejeonella rubra TaxID=990371 RepID=A0A1G9UFB6_9SPHI|nr:aspartate kinase [Daejeonella rubra]SDM58612.1 aspartate kinase [Daejeonella rubra]
MIKVFKFGGFAVSDAGSVKNLVKIVSEYSDDQILIIVSAMGKTTDALEKLCNSYVEGKEDAQDILKTIKQFHENIMVELFGTKSHPVFDEIANTFVEIEWMLEDEPHPDYDFNYDQIVSVGEFLSSRIVAAYLNENNIDTKWMDARDFIHTDNTYREGIIDMDKTRSSMPVLNSALQKQTVVTQGFIGGTSENFSTTLGREGSDYSAAIFASLLNAESLTVWKDVPGIMNADPRLFASAQKYEELPYSEALEMAYYGATVIHPKTIKPLQNAGVPLFVRPFLLPDEKGTRIDSTAKLNTDISAIIVKQNQMLLSISSKDFSFIDEHILIYLLQCISEAHIKLNMMQRSALSLSFCFNQDEAKFRKLYDILKDKFKCKYNEGLDLITVRHFKREELETITAGRTIIMEQFSRNTAQIILQ